MTQDSQSTSSDSGIQGVESAIGGGDMDEEAGEEEESPAPATIVQRVFGGRMRTCFQCRDCRNRSEFSDWFTVLHLAIPESEAAPPPVVQGCAPPPPKIDIQKELVAALETVSTAATSSDTLSPGSNTAPSPSDDTTFSQPQPWQQQCRGSPVQSFPHPNPQSLPRSWFCRT